MENNIAQQRLRVNFKVTTKGVMTPDVTAEGQDQEKVSELIIQGIDILKNTCYSEGFTWPGNKEEKSNMGGF